MNVDYKEHKLQKFLSRSRNH